MLTFVRIQAISYDPSRITTYTGSSTEVALNLPVYATPSQVVSPSATASDRSITVTWSAPTVLDGLDHSQNPARIKLMDGSNLVGTRDATSGSYTWTGLTNGHTYAVSIYSQGVVPNTSTKITSTTSQSIGDRKPAGAVNPVRNVVAQATGNSNEIRLSWTYGADSGSGITGTFITGTGSDGSSFEYSTGTNYGYDPDYIILTRQDRTNNAPLLKNGVAYTFQITQFDLNINGSAPVSSNPAIPYGTPYVDSLVVSGKNVQVVFHPQGCVLQSYKVLGLATVPASSDPLIIQSTVADISSISSASNFAALSSYPMTVTFSGQDISKADFFVTSANPNNLSSVTTVYVKNF
jgi:hypothetical protein